MTVESRDRRVAAGDDKRLRKDFGTVGLLFTAVGSIIGSGWLFGALNASQIAGPASIFSWFIGMVMFVLIGLTFAELGTMFPHSGGVARYPQYSHGSFTSFGVGWITWVAAASVAPIEVLACIQYSQNWLPITLQVEREGAAVLTGPGLIVSILLMGVFVGVNFFGVRWFARLNNVLVWWKLLVLVVVIVAFVAVSFNADHFTEFGFMPSGPQGIFSAVATAGVAFAYLGFRQGVELAGETNNPKRNVPLTVIGSVVLCGLLYIGLQIAFIGATPTEAISAGGWANVGENFTSETDTLALFGPLAAIASILGMAWLAFILYLDAVISPGDTGLIYAGVTGRLSYAMGRNRNAPKQLSKVNRHGVPWVSLILAWAVGCLFFLPFPGWQQLVGFVTTATVLSFGAGPLVLVALRRAAPGVERPFKLPGGPVIPFLALWSANLIVYWSGWEQNRLLFIGVVFGFVLFGLNQALSRKGTTPPVDFKHGWWLLVWLAGLALISYLGSYGAASDATQSVGNLELFGLAGGFLWTFILAAVALVLATRFALPKHRVNEILEGGHEEPEGTPETS